MSTHFTKADVLEYVHRHTLAVVSTIGAGGAPHAALVGVAATDALQVIFDTVSTSRKHGDLLQNPRAAVTFSGPGEQTLQFEGIAHPVSLHDPADELYRETYYSAWPGGRDRLLWPNLSYWRISPRWARYSDYDRGPLIVEFHWDGD